MKTKEEIELVVEIAKRAENMGIVAFNRETLMKDLESASQEFDLRLTQLLMADDFNFIHDIAGIQQNINRKTKKMENLFVPRYAGF